MAPNKLQFLILPFALLMGADAKTDQPTTTQPDWFQTVPNDYAGPIF